MPKKITIEESFASLDAIIEELQNGDRTVDESFQKYEEGMKLIKNCNTAIDKVEKKLEVINGEESAS